MTFSPETLKELEESARKAVLDMAHVAVNDETAVAILTGIASGLATLIGTHVKTEGIDPICETCRKMAHNVKQQQANR